MLKKKIKIKYVLIISLVFILLLSNCGCHKILKQEKYELLYGYNEIYEISIVDVVVTDKTEYKTIHTILDRETFLKKFEEIMFQKYLFGDPVHISSGYAIKFLYKNGDYEYVTWNAQETMVEGRSGFGKHYCDESQFLALLNQYIG